MKQETINIIKSMAEQGFLVIVDPEIYNGNETTVVISEKQEEERNPESSVIFTNCVGEVFTDNDRKNNATVFWASFNPLQIRQGNVNSIKIYSKLGKATTDIFRSKKSLLKYLYETCD